MHRVELNTDIQSMFFLPGKFHLTWESPGPIDIDLTTFSEQEKNWLRNAKIKNVLKIVNLEPSINIQKNISAQSQKPVNLNLADQTVAKDIIDRSLRLNTVLKILASPTASIYKHVDKSNDILELRILLEQEVLLKNRAKIIKALQLRLQALSSQIAVSIGSPLGQNFYQKDKNLPEIEEEIEATITINLGAKDE